MYGIISGLIYAYSVAFTRLLSYRLIVNAAIFQYQNQEISILILLPLLIIKPRACFTVKLCQLPKVHNYYISDFISTFSITIVNLMQYNSSKYW